MVKEPSLSELEIRQELLKSQLAIATKIKEYKQYLKETDYIHPKCAEEGLDINQTYSAVLAKRKECRAWLDSLEQEEGE